MLLRYRCRADGLTGDAVNCHKRELRVLDKIEESYDLAPQERNEVSTVIRHRRASLEFELGKAYLSTGEYANARECFRKANNLRKTWKTAIAFWITRLSPKLMRAIFEGRM